MAGSRPSYLIVLIWTLIFQASANDSRFVYKPITNLNERRPSAPKGLRIVSVSDGLTTFNLGPTVKAVTHSQLNEGDRTNRTIAAAQVFQQAKENPESFPDASLPVAAYALTNSEIVEVRQLVSAAMNFLGSRTHQIRFALAAGLSDADPVVRQNCIGAMSELGLSGKFALTNLIHALSDPDILTRSYAAGALGNFGHEAAEASDELLRMLNDQYASPKFWAVFALGQIGGLKSKETLPGLTSLARIAAQNNDGDMLTNVANAVLNIANDMANGDQLSGMDELKSAYSVVSSSSHTAESVKSGIDRSIKYLVLISRSGSNPAGTDRELSLSTSILAYMNNTPTFSINGKPIQVRTTDSYSGKVKYLGPAPDSLLQTGLNWIDLAKQRIEVWWESDKLDLFTPAYTNSYAVIVCLDRIEKQQSFERLSRMVSNGDRLADTLVNLGFSRQNILRLNDNAATSTAIDTTLKSFWRGGKHASADRLFFYFAGHGYKSAEGAGCLVTYDFDREADAQTSFLMRDLTTRHFTHIQAKHFMVAIDACHAGLTFLQGNEPNRMESFRSLKLIREETAKRARNILVATGDRQAVWDQGGIFTEALINGLNGGADFCRDNLIFFEELAVTVKDYVRRHPKNDVQQEPRFWSTPDSASTLFVRKFPEL